MVRRRKTHARNVRLTRALPWKAEYLEVFGALIGEGWTMPAQVTFTTGLAVAQGRRGNSTWRAVFLKADGHPIHLKARMAHYPDGSAFVFETSAAAAFVWKAGS